MPPQPPTEPPTPGPAPPDANGDAGVVGDGERSPEADRESRLRAVVEECLRRRAAGESVSDQSVLDSHPDLAPELAHELAVLQLLERARSSAGSRAGGPRLDGGYVSDGPLPEGLDAYSLVREVHRGGQGVVYEAIQRSTGRRVAVKVRRESFFGDRRDSDRFQREVEILAQLEHPNIVSVIDSGVAGANVFYVMDYVDGLPIDEHLAAHSLDVRGVLRLFEKIAAAVNAAHLRGVIHRDLKPANILVSDDGEPHLLDFGLARLLADFGDAARNGQTVAGQFVGSLPWASPEQVEGSPSRIDLRTDVYSLGVLLFQMLTRAMPYTVSSSEGGLRTAVSVILNAPPPRPSSLRRGIDADVDTIVLKCLSKEPERRYQIAGELAADVHRYLADRPIAARPPSLRYQLSRFARRNRPAVAAGVAVLLALGVGAVGTLVQLARARQAERLAEQRRVDAEHRAYVASMYAADAAIRGNDGPTARARLADAPEHQRGWEWRYLSRLVDQSRGSLDTPAPVASLARLGDNAVVGVTITGELRRWGSHDGAVAWTVPTIVPSVLPLMHVRASRDGSRVLVVNPVAVAVHDARDGRELRRWELGRRPALLCGVLTPDGSAALVAGRAGYGLHRLDVATGTDTLLNDDFIANVRDLDFNADASLLASVENPDLVLRDGTTGAVIRRAHFSAPEYTGEARVRFSPDGHVLATTMSTTIRLFQSPELTLIGDLRGHLLAVRSIEFSPDGASLVSASDDAAVCEWDLAHLNLKGSLLGHGAPALCACWTDQGTGVTSTSNEERGPRVWRLDEVRAARPAPLRRGETSFGFYDSGITVVQSGGNRLVRRSIETGEDTPLIDLPPLQFASMNLRNHFGSAVASDHRLIVFDTQSHTWSSPTTLPDIPPGTLPALQPYLTSISGDGRMVCWQIVGSNTVHVTDTAAGREVFTFPDGPPHWGFATFASDGRRLFLAFQHTLIVLDTGSWREVSRVESPQAELIGVQPSSDGKRASVTDTRGGLTVVDVESGRVLLHRVVARGPQVFASFSPDDRRLAMGGQDRVVRVLDAQTGDLLLTLKGHGSLITSIDWSENGRYLMSSSHDGVTLIWDAGPEASETRDSQTRQQAEK